MPIQAVVKWYNPDKGFGFVQLADGSGDAFLPKRPQVSETLSVDSSTAQQELPRRPRPERPMYPPADRAAGRGV